ncbi:hypothetical protein QO003_003175 [Arthrobacter silviterrae]|uniref:Glycosyltransferase RgtA/B/C/D-like domain-containing protein n=1 Tax=Arthrobacter silviterrae TaxID=2026658 RepID=A0ABX0DD48_9MICC|nr:hypothetical protein [Arthrobacter silviterrae]MDQ0278872.1 hypothetical protein [Arthrobacter silviterrae]NGN84851.1 hypothetical protein [Arthrobacter silviterrae]
MGLFRLGVKHEHRSDGVTRSLSSFFSVTSHRGAVGVWNTLAVETVAVLVALTLAVVAVWHMAFSSRSWMLYYDTETVLPAMIWGSGTVQHWALSAVLFLPEMALYGLIALMGMSVKATLTAFAVADFFFAYLALRMTAGLVAKVSRPMRVFGALLAFTAIVVFAFLDDSPRWDTFELVSLLSTATYYGATVIALIATIGIAAALTAQALSRGCQIRLACGLTAVAFISTASNPLYLGWVCIPLVATLLVLAWSRLLRFRTTASISCILAASAAAGLVARLPFAGLITKSASAYAVPGRALSTAIYYVRMLTERASSLSGFASLVMMFILIISSVILSRHFIRQKSSAAALVVTMGWMSPLITMCGAVALGAVGTRYLQPLFYAPAITLVLVPVLVRARWPAARSRPRLWRVRKPAVMMSLAMVVVLCCGLFGVALFRKSADIDSSIRCVDGWISAQNRVGAGRYWTIRGPKAYLANQSLLIQVDDHFNAYPWLVDRTDFNTRYVSFVIHDTTHPAPRLPRAVGPTHTSVVRCGRYTIEDFRTAVLPVGSAISTPVP